MWNKRKIALLLGTSLLVIPQFTFGKTVGSVNATALNVRAQATTSSSIVGKVYAKQSVEINNLAGTSSNRWYEVTVNNKRAYVKQEYLTLTKADGTVKASALNIRSYPDLSKSKVIGKLKNGTKVDVMYKVNGFYKIMINGSAGFVSDDYVTCKYDPYVNKQVLKNVGTIPVWTGGTGSTGNTGSTGSTGNTGSNKVTGEDIVNTAMKYLGNPYVYGGTSLTNGTDCSGFTQGVMKLHGITLPRTSRDQSKVGQLVSKSNLQKGDILFYGGSTSSINHCGIYIGNSQMIHASTPSTGIIISGINGSASAPLQVIRRVL